MEGEEPAQNPEEQVDLFRFDTLKVYEQGQPMEGIYEAETDNLDGVRPLHFLYLRSLHELE